MKLNLGAKLYAATAAVLMLMLVFVGAAIYGNRTSQAALTRVFENTVKPLLAVQAIDHSLQEVRFRVAGVILDQLPRPGSRIHLKEARGLIPQQWTSFTAANRADDPAESALIKKIEAGLGALPALFDKIDKGYEGEDRKSLEAIIEEDWPKVTKDVVKPLAELIAMQTRQMGETYAASAALGEKLNSIMLALFAAAVVLLLIGAFVVVRSITRPLHAVRDVLAEVARGNLSVRAEVSAKDEIGVMADSVNQTVVALHQTLAGIHQAADRLAQSAESLSSEARSAREEAGTQTDNVMKVSAAMEELTVSVAEISGRANEVAEASANARQIAEGSTAAVSDSKATTQRALEAVSSSRGVVGELSSEIEKISAITKVIKEIADQTNLLALNAAIEAARAGESGRGFAVVADEVRKLAERTTSSTADITQMISAIQGRAQAAVAAMATVSADVQQGAEQNALLAQSFARILDASGHLTRIAGQIADGTKEQNTVAQQTARNMETISQASERAGNSVRHVASTAQETAGTAQQLKALVDRFRLA